MLSSHVPDIPFGPAGRARRMSMSTLGRGGPGRSGVIATRVLRASIDRMAWAPDATRRAPKLGRGGVESRPLARSGVFTLHLGVDRDGTPAFVLRGAPEAIAARQSDLRLLHHLDHIGVATPPTRHVTQTELWTARLDWPACEHRPSPSAIDQYVGAAIAVPLRGGAIVATGEPHARDTGAVACVDAAVARLLDQDEQCALSAIWERLVQLDDVGLVDAASALCGARPLGLAAAARRAVVALAAEWTPISLGFSLHHVATATVAAGPSSEALVLLADELLHRLDLAHHYRTPVEPLASPSSALQLGEPDPVPA